MASQTFIKHVFLTVSCKHILLYRSGDSGVGSINGYWGHKNRRKAPKNFFDGLPPIIVYISVNNFNCTQSIHLYHACIHPSILSWSIWPKEVIKSLIWSNASAKWRRSNGAAGGIRRIKRIDVEGWRQNMRTLPTINEISLLGCSNTHIQSCRISKMSADYISGVRTSDWFERVGRKREEMGGIVASNLQWGIVGTAFCVLCRIIMYKRHMVFLLPIASQKLHVSAVPQASSQGSRCTSASALSRLDLLCLRCLNSPCQCCLVLAAMSSKPPQLHHFQLTRKFDKN